MTLLQPRLCKGPKLLCYGVSLKKVCTRWGYVVGMKLHIRIYQRESGLSVATVGFLGCIHAYA